MKGTSITLFYTDIAVGGTSDKVYRCSIVPWENGYVVNFEHGRRGGTMQNGTKTKLAVPFPEAEVIFNRIVAEKTGKGYKPEAEYASAGATVSTPALPKIYRNETEHPVELLEEITREECDSLLRSPDYWLQVKVDGHRRQILKNEHGIVSYNKKGTAVALPTDVVAELQRLPIKSFLLDGELIGSTFVAFDILSVNGKNLTANPYAQRFQTLEATVYGCSLVSTVKTWKTAREKSSGIAVLHSTRAEGAAFKRVSAPYRAGRNGQHKKFKFVKTVSCKVIATGQDGKANATLALLDKGKWREVGRASTIGKGTIDVGNVVEVMFLYATEGQRLYQPRIKEVRSDVEASECTMSQLRGKFKEGVKEAA